MHVALIGYGIENQAAYRYFSAKGDHITICDQNPDIELPEGVESQLGEQYLDDLDRFDHIIRTVGMHPSLIIDKNPSVTDKITTAVNIFFEQCKTPIIGVTGTKGKGTTSTLIYKILTAAGKKALLAGNIGTPMLDILGDASNANYVVLELSSFQLHDIKYSPHIAVCLMVVPEHLNWHADLAEYIDSKTNLFRYQKSDDVAVFNALNATSRDIAASSPSTHKVTYAVSKTEDNITTDQATVTVRENTIHYQNTPVMNVQDVVLLGRHNLENVSAAIAVTWDIIGGNVDVIKSVAVSFTGLEYRLQFIREVNGVRYYNDSFSTTPETAIAAIKSFSEPIVIILGGSDKGIPFDELVKTVKNSNVKHVLAIGDTGPIIAKMLQNIGYSSVTTEGLGTMEQIIHKASIVASEGDIVLLSTGCASFGMFENYKDRGNQFNQAVQELV